MIASCAGGSSGEEQVGAYAFAVKAAAVGYEGLVFDDQRVTFFFFVITLKPRVE